jgi:predicted DNA-binding protein (UPF0251 family)
MIGPRCPRIAVLEEQLQEAMRLIADQGATLDQAEAALEIARKALVRVN